MARTVEYFADRAEIDIEKTFKNQFSIRSDSLEMIKRFKKPLVVNLRDKNKRLIFPPNELESKILWRSVPQPSKFNKPFQFCYFSAEEKKKVNQLDLFGESNEKL